jgi:hypothetical protein
MNLIRRAILALAPIAGIGPDIAQVPPPVPALPDTEKAHILLARGQSGLGLLAD